MFVHLWKFNLLKYGSVHFSLFLLLGFLWEIRKRKSLEKEFVKKKNKVCSVKEFSDTILYNVDAYIILVDRNFLVEKTNYYNLNNTSER